MDRSLLQQLGEAESQRHLSELELALDSHAKWMTQLNRVFACSSALNPHDIHDHPHHYCQLGRWYHGIEAAELLENPLFVAIGEQHQSLHRVARELLLYHAANPGQPLPLHRYDQLIELSQLLRQQLGELHATIKHNLNSELVVQALANAPEGVLVTDSEGTILSVNKAFTQLTGYSREEAVGNTPHILYSGRQDRPFYQHMWQCLTDKGQWQGEIWNRRKDGEIYLESLSIAAVHDNSGSTTHYVGIFSDISGINQQDERLYRLAHYDLLTGVANRLLFQDHLRRAISLAERSGHLVAVMFLDLDGFKAVNDELGHDAGDELLVEIARRLRKHVRETDTVGRFGGDEFTIILPELGGLESATSVASKLIEVVAEPVTLGPHTVRVTTSIGISLCPAHSTEVEALIKQADLAMYYAKNGGKNGFRVFEPPML